MAYRQAFKVVRRLITKESEIISAIAPISSDLALLVEQQNNFLKETIIKQVAQEANDTRKEAITVISVIAIVVLPLKLKRLACKAKTQKKFVWL